MVPLFLRPEETFVNGTDLKEDLKRLVAFYEALPDEVRDTGLIHFAAHPPEDTSFLTTRLWDRYLPAWRELKDRPVPPRSPEEEKQLIDEINRQTNSPELQPSDETEIDKMDYATIQRIVRGRKGKWLRFSKDQLQRMSEHKKTKGS